MLILKNIAKFANNKLIMIFLNVFNVNNYIIINVSIKKDVFYVKHNNYHKVKMIMNLIFLILKYKK